MDELFVILQQQKKEESALKLISSNTETKKFGVSLTKEEALRLLESSTVTLKEQQRIEFGEGIIHKLVFSFCDSPYIYQDNYVDTLETLQSIFYLYKNESLDEVSDDELIEYMKNCFDRVCQGSLEYLEDTCLETFARNMRDKTKGFMGGHVDDENDW